LHLHEPRVIQPINTVLKLRPSSINLLKKEVVMANLVKGNRDVSAWRDFLDIDRFFMGGLPGRNMNFPAVNISEDEKSYSVEVVVPGFKKEDFKVKVEDDMLTISAETKSENKENGDGKEYSRREYTYSSFTRSFHLPENVKDDAIVAAYQDGI